VDDPSFGDSEVVEIQSIDDEPVSSLDLSGIENAPEQEESFEEILPEGFLVESEDELEGQEFSPPVFEADEMVIEAEELSFTEEMPGDIREDAIRAPAIQAAQPKQAEVRPSRTGDGLELPSNLKMEVKAVLSYMDQLLESLPEEKIEEFAKSEYFESYKKLFEELGLV
jgi:hypothetical protein